MTPRRVLIVTPHFPPNRLGGTEEKAFAIARSLMSRGVGVDVLCIERVEPGARTSSAREDDEYEGIRVRRVHLALGPRDDLRLWFDEPFLRAEIDALVAERPPDLVHLLSGYLWGVTPLDAARAAGVPAVVTLSDYWFLCPTIQLLRGDGSLCDGPEPIECARCLFDARRPFRAIDTRAPRLMQAWWKGMRAVPAAGALFGLPGRLDRLARRHRDLVAGLDRCGGVTVHSAFARDLHGANGFDPARMSVILNAVDDSRLDPVPHAAPTDELCFAYIGQVTPIKGVHVLVRAFRRLRRHGRKVRLIIRGNLNASPAYDRELRRLAEGDPSIVFGGPYEHHRVLSVLADAHVVVVPSLWYESATGTVCEGRAARRPVIASRVGGIAEIVNDGVDGLLFERGDVDDLARVMQRLIDEPDLLPHLTSRVTPLPGFEAHFMPDLLRVYEQAIARQAPRDGATPA